VGKERPARRWFREFFFQKKIGVDACELSTNIHGIMNALLFMGARFSNV
jgi:hypothetical protein